MISVKGQFLQVGDVAPPFSLVDRNLSDVTLADYSGKFKILNIFPSIDTPTCAKSVREFNSKANSLPATVVLCISADLPFAQSRFCGSEGLDKVVSLSTFRNRDFLEQYGVLMIDGPLAGLAARAVIVLDELDTVIHAQLVSEIKTEPDYAAALAVLFCNHGTHSSHP